MMKKEIREGSAQVANIVARARLRARQDPWKTDACAPQLPRPRRAWSARADLLDPSKSPSDIIGHLIALVRAHDHQRFSVTEAARELYMSVRQLHRICNAELNFPPGTLIDLACIESIAMEILKNECSLTTIATNHTFNDSSNMGRVFFRFVGMRPGLYRQTDSPTGRPKRPANWHKIGTNYLWPPRPDGSTREAIAVLSLKIWREPCPRRD